MTQEERERIIELWGILSGVICTFGNETLDSLRAELHKKAFIPLLSNKETK